ncbi:hypothetical protein [Leisingera caerulea]|uniref:hypothetical protein n=1 Tax=Leisingera caerulea TaxID=506591 RepID=UPI0004091783|nr:hypothetical protein [Leisingera caerulea]
MPDWIVPEAIEIPWKTFAGGERLWEVAMGDDWKFSYFVLKHPHTGKWVSNLNEGVDHDAPAGAVLEVGQHFTRCINRCLASRPLEEFLDDLKPDLVRVMGSERTAAATEALAAEAAGAASFRVRELPWLMTRAGNMITRGGDEFPWPFTYLAVRKADHWKLDDGEPRATRSEAQLDAQRHFEARISRLTTGPLEHEMRGQLIEAAKEGPDAFVSLFSTVYRLNCSTPEPQPM